MQRSVYSASCLRSSHQSYTTATSFVEFVAFLAFVAQKRQPRIPRLTRITGGGARRISRKILPLDISTTSVVRQKSFNIILPRSDRMAGGRSRGDHQAA